MCTCSRHALGALQRTLERVKQDLTVKINSLSLDQQCMQVREKLAQHPKPSELSHPKPTSK